MLRRSDEILLLLTIITTRKIKTTIISFYD